MLSLSTVKRYLKKLKTRLPLTDNRRSGRPCAFRGKKIKSLMTTIRHHKTLSCKNLATKYNCNEKTVRTTLKKRGFKKMKAKNVFVSSESHKNQREQWAQKHLNDKWAKTVFSDESFLQLQANTVKYWCRKGKKVYKLVPKNRKKLLFWGAFSSQGTFPLHFVEGRLDSDHYCEIIRENYIPHAKKGFRLLQDNDPKHASKKTTQWLHDHNVKIISIPSYSPDLNPIENLWSVIKRRVEKQSPTNLEQLKKCLLDEWTKVEKPLLKNLVNSMKKRCEAVIEAKGCRTKF
jgi:transposase